MNRNSLPIYVLFAGLRAGFFIKKLAPLFFIG